MKKVLVLLVAPLLIIFVGSAAWAENCINLSYDFSGKENCSYSNGNFEEWQPINNPFSVGYEHLFAPHKGIALGFGMEYQSPRSDNGGTGVFCFIPVYGVMNYDFPTKDKFFVTGRLGYDFYNVSGNYWYLNTTTDGGIYWAAGFGIKPVNHLKIGLLYSEDRGSGNNLAFSYNLVYSKLSLVAGYSF